MKAWFSYAWKIALGVALFAYVAAIVDWHEAYDRLTSLSPLVVVAGVAVVLLQAGLLGWRWQRIAVLEGTRLPVGEFARAILVSFFFSQGLPASLGADAFRLWWQTRRGLSTAASLRILAFDRIIGLVSLALVCAVSIVVLMGHIQGEAAVDSLMVLVTVCLFGFLVLVLPFRIHLTDILLAMRDRLPAPLPGLVDWVVDFRRLFRRVSIGAVGLILGLGIAVHLLTVVLGFLLARGLGTEIGFLDCLAAIAPALLVSYVPISVAGWGVREASIVFAFSLLGVPSATALLVSLGIGLIVLLVALLGGVIWALGGIRRLYLDEAGAADRGARP
ncbi:lysylphosphatidylglycerol synthase transmembrane domain-containing protein [Mangrovibrevibacter kandeliae]|uniref:lysylphosphatidylglycerol synthase transmembrane domain-containing protein n=1 Tax=Mangrovibrevibacter kandeliae TaxID=2968473 RepID=UPI002118ACFD|nr:lysylphosphatidylglycerol synthase transmembrane domain-containing protein [Aurantimonas sp. CSK15Z-1]MCQ8782842.1 flippase-like domain-containing protein [Aurantimonas sp. CSK15Z-1]